MAEESKLKIEFGVPEYGWLPTYIKCNDFEITLDVSDVPIDPMYLLCNSLIQILKGIDFPNKVLWHLEPYCYYLQISKECNDYKLQITESDNYDSPSKIAFETKGSFDYLIMPLYRSLLKFESKDYRPPHWEGLDKKRIQVLRQLVKEKKEHNK